MTEIPTAATPPPGPAAALFVPNPELADTVQKLKDELQSLRAQLDRAETAVRDQAATIAAQRESADQAAISFQQVIAERNALIATRCPTTRVQLFTLIQPLSTTDVNARMDADLADRLNNAWTVLHYTMIAATDGSLSRIVTLQRPERFQPLSGMRQETGRTDLLRIEHSSQIINKPETEQPEKLEDQAKAMAILELPLPWKERQALLHQAARARAFARVPVIPPPGASFSSGK